VVTLGHDGEASIHTGYVKPEDAPEKPAKQKVASEDGRAGGDTLSASAHRSVLTAALMERPDVALAATVYTMALQVFYNGCRGDTALQITASAPRFIASRIHRQRWPSTRRRRNGLR
jgi:hypothetical protein